jgi:hypothetical protein
LTYIIYLAEDSYSNLRLFTWPEPDDLTWLHVNIGSGDSSSAFFSSSSLFNVEWRRAAVHVHGPHLRDNNSRNQFEMVSLHLNLNSDMSWIFFFNLLMISIFCLWRYLDVAGMKRSKAYLINGVVIFIAWLVGQVIAV